MSVSNNCKLNAFSNGQPSTPTGASDTAQLVDQPLEIGGMTPISKENIDNMNHTLETIYQDKYLNNDGLNNLKKKSTCCFINIGQ